MSKKIGTWWNTAKGIVYLISAGCSIFLFFYVFREKMSWLPILGGKFVNLLVMYWDVLVSVVFGILFAMIIALLYLRFRRVKQEIDRRITRLERYRETLFKDDFEADLERNWEYEGEWNIDNGELSITQSEKGGITKIGPQWDDYSFEFTGVIVNQYIGWLVRAQDLLNCYMLQLNPFLIRPHLRLEHWHLLEEKPHGLPLRENEPIHVRTEVRGLGISVYINEKKIYHEEEFFSADFPKEKGVLLGEDLATRLPFRKGRVGFRLSSKENGRFSRCRVLSL